jgi:hypothetical protein
MAAGRLSFALAEVIDQHGRFCELDTDRGSHCFHTPQGRGGGIEDLVLLVRGGSESRDPDCRNAGYGLRDDRTEPEALGTGHRMPD